MSYRDFVSGKLALPGGDGFSPIWMPDILYDFQKHLVEWNLGEGCGADLIDCGLGKSPIQLTVAENIVRHTNKPVLIGTPLAVSHQTLREAAKFGIEAVRCVNGRPPPGARVVVTNFQRMHHFDASDYGGILIDEASILKNVIGKQRRLIQRMMDKVRYRSLYSGTAAPNAFIELGTFSEALGRLREDVMKERFFRQVDAPTIARWSKGQRHSGRGDMHSKGWRFRGHAEEPFWRWVSSWSRSARKPGDLGFPHEDYRYDLPELIQREHVVTPADLPEGLLFHVEAKGLREQRAERRKTLVERCDKVAELVDGSEQSVAWCHLNPEGERLGAIIPDAVEVAGQYVRRGSAVSWRPPAKADLDEQKESAILAFMSGEIRVLITKSTICGWGLNLERCHRMVSFPSHSFEQWYQVVRRFWRFGQDHPVTVDVVTTPGEGAVMANLKAKQARADHMFERLVSNMNGVLDIIPEDRYTIPTEAPSWL